MLPLMMHIIPSSLIYLLQCKSPINAYVIIAICNQGQRELIFTRNLTSLILVS